MTWKIAMFSFSGHYGFCASETGQEVFFHAQDFHRIKPGGPLPITGEAVELGEISHGAGNRPRTNLVRRLVEPELRTGRVHSFDSNRGWGFIDLEGQHVFLHMSDRQVEWMPVIGSQIQFYVGSKDGKPRACWARPVRERATIAGRGSYE